MKRFESLYNEWIDGTLDPGREKQLRAHFPDATNADRERADYEKIREVFREDAAAREIPHPDFINAKVIEEIDRDRERERPPKRTGRLVLAGGLLTGLALLLAALLLPQVLEPYPKEQMVTELIESRTGSANVYASSFRTPDGQGMVIWLEGVEYIPADRTIR